MSSDERTRLHPASLVFRFLGHARGFAVPLIVLLVFSKGENWELYGLFALVPLMLFEAWHYFTLRYWITGAHLIVKQGVVFREEVQVPLERIQAIDSTQNFLQRIFGVVEVRVETAGGGKPEAHLRVLSVAARDRLRRDVVQGQASLEGAARALEAPSRSADAAQALDGTAEPEASSAPPPRAGLSIDDEGEELLRVSPFELVVLGLNPWRGLAIMGVGFALAQQFNLLDAGVIGQAWDFLTLAADEIQERGFWHALLVEAAAVLTFIALVLGLSIGSVYLALYGFSLRRRGDEFVTECGLLTRHATTIKQQRVQFLSVQRPLFLRLFERSLVMVRTAGGQAAGDNAGSTRKWLTPVILEERVEGLVRAFLPRFALEGVDWHGLSRRAWLRMLVRAAMVAAVLHVPLVLWEPTRPFAPFTYMALALAFGLNAHLQHGRIAWARTEDAFLVRDGVVQQRLAIVPLHRIQSVSAVSNPFDRRHKMKRLAVDTAGSGMAHRAEVPYLQAEVADALVRDLCAAAEANLQDPQTMGPGVQATPSSAEPVANSGSPSTPDARE